MDISVLICTHNRADSLARALDSLTRLRQPANATWEVLVVANACTDHTEDVGRRFQDRLPLRLIVEPTANLSRARNRALLESQGNLLLFLDDDVEVDPDWLCAYHEAAQRHPEAAFFGGRVLPRYETTPPTWFAENANGILKGVVAHLDLGPAERFMSPTENLFVGANMGFRRSAVADQPTLFPEEFARAGQFMIHGEETGAMERLRQQGQRGHYVPAALVHHWISPRRMTTDYVHQWFVGKGRTRVRKGRIRRQRLIAGVPLAIWLEFVYHTLRYGIVRWTGPSRLWLRADSKRAAAWGIITELRRQQPRT